MKLNLKEKLQAYLTATQIKRIGRYFALFFAGFALLLIVVDQIIGYYVRKDIYYDIDKVPNRPYGLVLGTSKYFSNNTLNLFYYNRLLAAQRLFEARKVDYLLLSGDNRTLQYNEPRTMLQDLKKMGVPQDFIYLDFAGFRTLDSVIRADQVFKAHSLTIISQKFHCERALFIAKFHNIDAICFAADYPQVYSFVRVREFFARLQAVWDLLVEREPHFLGAPEPLPPPVTIPDVNSDI
ncbi:SanA/YdcF family protein [Aggregatibacter actinomycetemcomitans]|uniref:SanA/YdcF family protein n=1 Tax=Aggregatibacter actinomycetemcomitans TaxID=714 RepID=UPI0011DCA40E|nr:ElyC/SanA/YdcF family protein [Aggregatibacter actinomycetemcomitans]QEH45820.1 vancomycin high temperature exclusion protein [Aggregatibacter actinomycetemcomitans]QEH49252.1 vancomycin high temperature exclusion protein [Aggregatibacter actinomycetemcomitans]